jgi:hypothetical protein
MNRVTSAQPLPNRDLAKLAMTADDWDAAYLGSKYPGHVIADTAQQVELGLTVPLAHLEPKLDGSLAAPVKAHLHTIIAAINPSLSQEQVNTWVNATLIKLADLAPPVLKKATERALHCAFGFPGEVEGKVRELADEHLSKGKRAIARLKEAQEKASDTRTGGLCLTAFEFERQAFAKRRDATTPDQIEECWAWERREMLKQGKTVQRLIAPMDRSDILRGERFGWLTQQDGQLIEHNMVDGKPVTYPLDRDQFPVQGIDYERVKPTPIDLRKDEE